jgi:hypothetical protein
MHSSALILRRQATVERGVEMASTAWLLAMAVAMASTPVEAKSLQIEGTAGYLSEWEISGAVTEGISAEGNEFLGRLTWKHVGLCSVNGPQQKSGEIRFRISRSGSLARINATLSFDGSQ